MVRNINLQVDESIYQNVMFLLNNLKIDGLKIIENKQEGQTDTDNFLDFSQYDIKAFKNIEDPIKWQKKIRDEWN
jgi:hypothetical protein